MTVFLIEVFLFGHILPLKNRGTWAEVPGHRVFVVSSLGPTIAATLLFLSYVSRIGFKATAPFCYIVAMKFALNECRFTFSHGERLEFRAFPSLLT